MPGAVSVGHYFSSEGHRVRLCGLHALCPQNRVLLFF